MTPIDPSGVQPAFRALADPTRRGIIALLADRDMTIAEVAGHFDMTRAAVKKHLTVLYDGDIVVSEMRGRERINRLQPMALKTAADWLNHFDRFWSGHLAALKDAAETQERKNREQDT